MNLRRHKIDIPYGFAKCPWLLQYYSNILKAGQTDFTLHILSVIPCFTSFGGAILCCIAFRHPCCNTPRSRRVRLHKRGGPGVYLSSTNLSFFAEGLNEKRIRLGERYSYCAVQRTCELYVPSNVLSSTPFLGKTFFFLVIFFSWPPLKVFGGVSKIPSYKLIKVNNLIWTRQGCQNYTFLQVSNLSL